MSLLSPVVCADTLSSDVAGQSPKSTVVLAPQHATLRRRPPPARLAQSHFIMLTSSTSTQPASGEPTTRRQSWPGWIIASSESSHALLILLACRASLLDAVSPHIAQARLNLAPPACAFSISVERATRASRFPSYFSTQSSPILLADALVLRVSRNC